MIVGFRWKAVGPVCEMHAGPCYFEWVPWVDQGELFNDIDSVVSVSGLDEDEDTVVAGSPINPSSQLVLF